MSLAHSVLLPLLFLSQLLLCSGQYPSIPCHFNCGRLGKLYYPFSTEYANCLGMIAVDCTASEPKAQFGEEGKWYPVNYVNYLLRRMEIHDEDLQSHLLSNRCDLLQKFSEQAFLKSFKEELAPAFIFFKISETLPFFKCEHKSNSPSTFFNRFGRFNCTDYDLYYNKSREEHLPSLPANLTHKCSVVHLPSARVPYNDTGEVRKDNLTSLWSANFTIEWKILQACVDCSFNEGGVCQRPLNQSLQCIKSGKKEANAGRNVAIGVSIGVVILGSIFLLLIYTIKNSGKLVFSRETVTTRTFEEFIKHQALLSPKRYSFKEIKDMTQSFKNKLGQGGYGSVFKGVQNDGKLVAVKVLSEIKDNGEEFINEVASIRRTSHVNIVSLLGYCFEGSKRALIYEFMPNGSLEKYIYDKTHQYSALTLDGRH